MSPRPARQQRRALPPPRGVADSLSASALDLWTGQAFGLGPTQNPFFFPRGHAPASLSFIPCDPSANANEKLILQSRATTPPSVRRDSHDAAVSTHPHDYWLPMYSVVFLFLFLFFPCYTVQVLSFFFFSSFLFLRSIMWWSSLDNFFIKIILKKYTENRTQKFYDEFCV